MLGKWQKVDGKETVEFTRDGTVILASGPTQIKTNFRMKDPKTLDILLASLGSVTLQVAVDKDILTLTDAKGHALKYKKVVEPPAAQKKAEPPKKPEPEKKAEPAKKQEMAKK